ncbi:hypothetical protein X975_10522, partial [Stegodyphus mimosarum]
MHKVIRMATGSFYLWYIIFSCFFQLISFHMSLSSSSSFFFFLVFYNLFVIFKY